MRVTLRSYGDSIMSFAALAALLGWIVASDIRLRDQMARRVQGVSFDLADAGARVGKVTSTFAAAAQANSIEYAHLWTFLVVAIVLTIWMLRS